MLYNKIQNQRGFSMVETMVALTLLVIMGTAIISLMVTLISANNSAKRRSQAIGFAEEGVEQVRNYFQTNGFGALVSKANQYGSLGTCYGDGTLQPAGAFFIPVDCTWSLFLFGGLSAPSCGYGWAITESPNRSYGRYVALFYSAAYQRVRVRSVVQWPERGVCQSTEVDTYFYSY